MFKHQTIPCLAFKEFLNMILLLPQVELLPSEILKFGTCHTKPQ